jgi:hypothetical protein
MIPGSPELSTSSFLNSIGFFQAGGLRGWFFSSWDPFATFVIPAKAGIQANSGAVAPWIPAYAGMTGGFPPARE